MPKDNLPAVRTASDLTITFPDRNLHITQEEAIKTRELIVSKGAYTPDGRAYINKEALPHLLSTDMKGVNRIYNDLGSEDKLELGDQKLISVPAVNKEISKRIEEPRDTLVRERLRDSEACINSLRDAPELEKYREAEESRNRREQPLLKAKKIKAENLSACQLTGDPLKPNAHAHHIERQADKPRKSRDLENIIIANPEPHTEIHRQGAESPSELQSLCEKKGWNNPLASSSTFQDTTDADK